MFVAVIADTHMPHGGRACLSPVSSASVVYGHTHQPQVARVGEAWILNPGSPTERPRAPTHTMLELHVTARRIEPELIQLP